MLPIVITASLIASTYGHVLDRRQLSQAAVVQPNNQPAAIESNDTISLDVESSINSNTEDYYLGFREADFQQPYAKSV
jgi:hypothetical protein